MNIQAPPRSGCRCGQISCRAERYRLDYSFRLPSWLASRLVAAAVSYSNAEGPELCLRMQRIRSPNDPFWNISQSESLIPHFMSLLRSGKASVLDVDPDGYSLIYVS